jgi:5-methylcytosine-specific restriction endonuclease McrA
MAYTEVDREYYRKNRDRILSKQRERYHTGKGKEVKQTYYLSNRKRILDDKKKYTEDNKEIISDRNRVWYLNNAESRKQERKRYYYENQTKILEDAKRYYQNNKERIRSHQNTWAKTEAGRNSELVRSARRRALKLAAEGSFTVEDIKDLYATQGGRCYYCSVEIESGYHIDHMIPLSRGGRNDVSNICLACPECNLKKYTKTAEEFQNAADA